MRWICAICTEVLDLTKPICFAPCGHIFHRGCLETWLLESSTCPECRASVKSSSLKKVFPNAKTNTEGEFSVDSLDVLLEELERQEEKFKRIQHLFDEVWDFVTKYVAEGSIDSDDSLDVMLEKLERQEEKIKRSEHLFDEVNDFATKYEAEAAMFRQKYLENEHKLHLQYLQMKKMKPQETEIKNLKIEICNLKAENEMCNNVKAIIRGEQKEVDKIIRECQGNMGGQTGSLESVKKLATFLAVLKREFNMVVAKKNKIKAECIILKKELASKKQECQKLLNRLSKNCTEHDEQNLNRISKKCSAASNLPNAINNFDDSPITIKFDEKKRKISTVVIDDAEPCYFCFWHPKSKNPKLAL